MGGLREDKTKQKSKGQQTSAPTVCTKLSQFGLVLVYITMNSVAAYFLYSPELTEMVYLFTVGVLVLLSRFVFMFLFLADFRLPFTGYFGASEKGYERIRIAEENDENDAFAV